MLKGLFQEVSARATLQVQRQLCNRKTDVASCNTSQIVVFTLSSLVKALSPSYKTLAALFPLACYLSCQERGLGLGSVAELRFEKRSGMVEPLIYRKD